VLSYVLHRQSAHNTVNYITFLLNKSIVNGIYKLLLNCFNLDCLKKYGLITRNMLTNNKTCNSKSLQRWKSHIAFFYEFLGRDLNSLLDVFIPFQSLDNLPVSILASHWERETKAFRDSIWTITDNSHWDNLPWETTYKPIVHVITSSTGCRSSWGFISHCNNSCSSLGYSLHELTRNPFVIAYGRFNWCYDTFLRIIQNDT